MSWSIVEVARLSGITARTLRHYDAIGLLTPSWVGSGGRRHYGHEELLRLQRILLLRDLGLPLPAIAQALSDEDELGTVEALRRHAEWLEGERERLGTLLGTVRKTIESIESGNTMSAEAMFEGFENPYEAEARQRWGDEAVDASYQRLRQLPPSDAERARNGFGRVHEALKPLSAAGVPVEDERVQAIIAEHYGVVCLFWTPNAAAYRGLGEMYVEDERFRRNIGGGDDDLVRYLRAGMEVYADTVLA
jgi:DNA-binding transcriptional MerR regulator